MLYAFLDFIVSPASGKKSPKTLNYFNVLFKSFAQEWQDMSRGKVCQLFQNNLFYCLENLVHHFYLFEQLS